MSEPDTSDALQAQIEEAQQSGDVTEANRLYQQQIGTTDLAEDEGAVPAVVDARETGNGALVVATNAEDETAIISGGMDFAGNPEHTAHALACMEVWGEDEVAPLKAKWGSDMGANLGFFQAFALAHPDIHEILVASGFGDHPAIIEVGAILGRRYATKGGDPTTITTRKGTQAMDSTIGTSIEAQIDDLQEAIEKAQVQHDSTKANRLYQAQLRLQALLPGGSEPIVGSSGRTA